MENEEIKHETIISYGTTGYVNGNRLDGSILDDDYGYLFGKSELEISNGVTLGNTLKDEIIAAIFERLGKSPIVKHECHSCGAVLEMDENKHIFVCKYCGNVYAINTEMVNAR